MILLLVSLVLPNLAQSQNCAQDSMINPSRVIPGFSSCMPTSVVNSAFQSARNKLQLDLSSQTSNLAETIEETTKIIAQEYGLSKKKVFDFMSLVDTTKTEISDYCPSSQQSDSKCDFNSPYRNIDGTCNNNRHPKYGSAMTAFKRFLPSSYGNDFESPRLSQTGAPLPSPRHMSRILHKDESISTNQISMLFVIWGQFLDHDITLTAETHNAKCCDGSSVNNLYCTPIQIFNDDSFYSDIYNVKCLDFVRSQAGLREDCKLGAREQINQISSFIDANNVYSNDPEKLKKLRSLIGGKMKTFELEEQGFKDLLPQNTDEPDSVCNRPDDTTFCFMGGDVRASENPLLTMIHTLFVREHNRLAEELAQLNPDWNDEIIFQEARSIVAATIQHITFNEFLPTLLGDQGLASYTAYDSAIDPAASSGFTTAAFRFGHSLLPGHIELWNVKHEHIRSIDLSSILLQPFDLYEPGSADQFLVGMANQLAQNADQMITNQVTNHLFQKTGDHFGMDLAALNIQRGRDHGIPSLNRWREWCNLAILNTWADLQGVFISSSVASFQTLYKSPEDIDLWSGGLSELPTGSALLGPTFTCIIKKQFDDLRTGDRYWYENDRGPERFTVDQVEQIRKTSLARIICDNSDNVQSIQKEAMKLNLQVQGRLDCSSSEIPKMDLSYWDTPKSNGYTRDPTTGNRYKVMNDKKRSWIEAKMRCEQDGGEVASIKNKEEWHFVKGVLASSGAWRVWLGGSDEQTEGTWVWTDGSSVSFSDWYPGEPNGNGNCLYVFRGWNWQWGDYICTTTATASPWYAVCKIPA